MKLGYAKESTINQKQTGQRKLPCEQDDNLGIDQDLLASVAVAAAGAASVIVGWA